LRSSSERERERGKKEEVSDALRLPEERKEIFLFPKEINLKKGNKLEKKLTEYVRLGWLIGTGVLLFFFFFSFPGLGWICLGRDSITYRLRRAAHQPSHLNETRKYLTNYLSLSPAFD
jgi:hypothetical protein